MDKIVNVISAGTQQIMQAQSVYLNNLANQNTTGFREDFVNFQTKSMSDTSGLASRSFVVSMPNKYNFLPGPINKTNRDLDIAIQSPGWFVIKTPSGEESYSRDGAFQVNDKGELVNSSGLQVLGTKGPINIPVSDKIEVAPDGTISVVPKGQASSSLVAIDKIKLVNPEVSTLVKKEDGLFYRNDNKTSSVDAKVKIVSGFLEGSNVSSIDTLTKIIDLSRQYESQMKLMKITEKMSDSTSDIASV